MAQRLRGQLAAAMTLEIEHQGPPTVSDREAFAGFQYPAAMWKLDGPRGPEILFSYSVNKVRCVRQTSLLCLLRFSAVFVVSHNMIDSRK